MVLLLVIPGLAFPVFAEFPPRPDSAVEDLAHVISPEDAGRLEALAQEVGQQYGIEVAVLTLKSLPPGETLEPYATRLFNHWGLGDRHTNRGLLILLPIEQRQIRIELGSGFGRGYDQAMQQVIQEDMVPLLKVERFGEGIHAGITSAARMLSAPSAALSDAPLPAGGVPRTVVKQPTRTGLSWTWTSITAALTAGLLAVVLFVRGIFRYRPRRCSKCRQKMIRLSEVEDDKYLDQVNIDEEIVKSVDYDVWLCLRCEEHVVARYTNWLSGYRSCPRCRAKTLRVSSRIVSRATTYSTGVKEVTKSCYHCDYHSVSEEIIPRVTESSSDSSWGGSSGGSSSGGGSSTGGGASGSW